MVCATVDLGEGDAVRGRCTLAACPGRLPVCALAHCSLLKCDVHWWLRVGLYAQPVRILFHFWAVGDGTAPHSDDKGESGGRLSLCFVDLSGSRRAADYGIYVVCQ